MMINKIVASSWYLSSFSYMMHGHTYVKGTIYTSDCVRFILYIIRL